jgi:hypothetical protein
MSRLWNDFFPRLIQWINLQPTLGSDCMLLHCSNDRTKTGVINTVGIPNQLAVSGGATKKMAHCGECIHTLA